MLITPLLYIILYRHEKNEILTLKQKKIKKIKIAALTGNFGYTQIISPFGKVRKVRQVRPVRLV